MFCQNCGQPLEEGGAFCTRCGAPVAPANKPMGQPANRPVNQPVNRPMPQQANRPMGQPANRPAAQPNGRPPKPTAQNGMKKRKTKPKKLVLPIVAGVLVVTIVVLTVIWVPRLKDPTKDFERITFGSYEQDNTTSNGKEEIEWLVLKREGNRMLVVSRYALDSQVYHAEEDENVTWETCSLRDWLNDEFYHAAFSDSEKAKIITASVVSGDNPEYGTNGGNNTSDKVSLLSRDELVDYFFSLDARKCVPTEYAKALGVSVYGSYIGGKRTCCWWLRSIDPFDDLSGADYVDSQGHVSNESCFYDTIFYAVRPAMWIDLDR